MKHIEVVAAVIIENKSVFCAQRPNRGETALTWEFPGGKIEAGETHKSALERELSEELLVTAVAGDFLTTIHHQYTTFNLTMHLYATRITKGRPQLAEHVDSRWMAKDELRSVDWAPADWQVLPLVENLLKNSAKSSD